MRKVYEYSHLGGSEILRVRFPQIEREIDEVIKTTTLWQKTKISQERTMKGRPLYSPRELNGNFKREFRRLGFAELKDTYTIAIPNYQKRIPGAYKQIDFAKGQVLVEAQFGKYAFMFYDMAKF